MARRWKNIFTFIFFSRLRRRRQQKRDDLPLDRVTFGRVLEPGHKMGQEVMQQGGMTHEKTSKAQNGEEEIDALDAF